MVTTLLLKQLITFYSDRSMKVSRYTVHGIVVHDISAAICNPQYKVLSICQEYTNMYIQLVSEMCFFNRSPCAVFQHK